MTRASKLAAVLLLVAAAYGAHAATRTINVKNQCSQTLWVATSNLKVPGTNTDAPNGWVLNPGQTTAISVPNDWVSGRLWARTGCVLNSAGHLQCATGDCPLPASMYSAANNGLHCHFIGGVPPTSVVEWTLRGYGGADYYDLSQVDGYNLPVQVSPSGAFRTVNNPSLPAKFNCGSAVINTLTEAQCPPEMRKLDSAGKYVACWSPCKAWHDPEQTRQHPVIKTWDESLICCNCGSSCGSDCGCGKAGCKHGCSWMDTNPAHANMRCFVQDWPLSSLGTSFPSVFKANSPDAYSWQFDDDQSTYQCLDASYDVTFCPSTTPPPPPGPTCTGSTVQANAVDLYGSDISNAPAANIGACIQLCQTTGGCSAVTLAAGVCYMKSQAAAANQKACAGCVSAYCIPSASTCTAMQQLPAIDLYGSDISNAPTASIDECIAQCKASAACKAATFAGNVCYLKTAAALSNQKYCAGCVSAYCAGTAHCPDWVTAAATDLYGGDLDHSPAADMGTCANVCSANPQCVAATLSAGVCYLKGGASLANQRACAGCTSGKCGGNLSASTSVAAAADKANVELAESAGHVFADGSATAAPAPEPAKL